MSTRSNIAILLREEDRNRDLETEMGTIVNANGKPYLYVYCHNDGYPSGVGQDLKDMFDGADYEDALEYILMGDRSTTDLSYWQWRREDNVDPVPADTEEDCFNEEYLYILEEVDGSHRIHVRQYGAQELLTNDDVREEVEDWFNENITEEDIENYKSGNYNLCDMVYDCYYDIDLGDGDETEEGDDFRDVISETLESLLQREIELAEDEEEEETKIPDEVYQVNSHGDMVGPKQITVNSHGDIVYTDATDWR